MALSKYGHGDTLRAAVLELDTQELELFLVEWRRVVRQDLCEDPAGHLGRRYQVVAEAITDDFPNMEVVNYYVRPATTALDGFQQQRPLPRVPDIARLTQTCEVDGVFRSPLDIALKFMSVLWPGVLLRSLMVEALNRVSSLPEHIILSLLTSYAH